MELVTTDHHTAHEPFRIVTGGAIYASVRTATGFVLR
jgi:hypothetical protein